MQVKISSDELDAIERCELLSSIKVGPTSKSDTAVGEVNTVLELTEDEMDDPRDTCIERQQISGFDKDYKLNALGHVLQGLIDKLYS